MLAENLEENLRAELRHQIRLQIERRAQQSLAPAALSELQVDVPQPPPLPVQQLQESLDQLQRQGLEIGAPPPKSPTLRGRFSAQLMQLFSRLLWWRNYSVQAFAAATHRCCREYLQVLDASARFEQTAAQALDRLSRKVSELEEAVRGESRAATAAAQTLEAPAGAPAAEAVSPWKELLYPRCILNHWQMFDAERLALTALLYRLQPKCAIEVGTFHGGSLSLIAQHAEVVFSLDVDPGVRDRVRHLRNVSFVIGDSGETLPCLLEELTAAGVAVDLILIDGDHSYAGVRRDVASVLRYRPLKPMVVLAHDSFNPECRRGLLEAGWSDSPYCHFVDLDFVPGQIVQYPGPSNGQMWGGLAAAYLAPVPRQGDLPLAVSADALFRAAYASQYLQSGAAASA